MLPTSRDFMRRWWRNGLHLRGALAELSDKEVARARRAMSEVATSKEEDLESRRKRIREERAPLRAFMPQKLSKGKPAAGPAMLEPLDAMSEDIESAKAWAVGKSYFVETLGCQMNVADSEIVGSILEGVGYHKAESMDASDVVFVNTCAIRENAESKAIQRLQSLRKNRPKGQQIGVLGCMAERMKERLLEDGLVNVVAGPDAYRDLPNLLSISRGDERAMNVQLSVEETYADIAPVRHADSSWLAYISITRGCNNMCSYCIVPFTRGRERSRSALSILKEVEQVSLGGVAKEITLLGQNVNSYYDKSESSGSEDTYSVAPGFSDLYRLRRGDGVRFAELLDRVASVDKSIRIRFTSPHPKDFTEDVLEVIAKHENICHGIHLPAQSGSDAVLKSMRRGYTRQAYIDLVKRARSIIGDDLELTSDFISGFCGETEEDHMQTLSLMEEVGFTQAFMFAYSERERTHAYHKMQDDIPEDVKLRRLGEVVETFRRKAGEMAATHIGKEKVVLIEGPTRRDANQMQGRTNGVRRCIVLGSTPETHPPGTYVKVKVTDANMATLKGEIIETNSATL